MIVAAVQKGPMIYAYNEKGLVTAQKHSGDGQLMGFTSTTFSVYEKTFSMMKVWDEQGRLVTSRHV